MNCFENRNYIKINNIEEDDRESEELNKR